MGSGKSSAATFFCDLGATVLSADEAARAVLEKGSPVLAHIAEAFGPEALTAGGELNRELVSKRVFSSPKDRLTLERLTHPAILDRLRAQAEAAIEAGRGPVVIEAPLLFEAGMENWFDEVIVVTAPESAAIRRLAAKGVSVAEARRRRAAQMPETEKISRASYVLANDGSIEELRLKTAEFWSKLSGAHRGGA